MIHCSRGEEAERRSSDSPPQAQVISLEGEEEGEGKMVFHWPFHLFPLKEHERRTVLSIYQKEREKEREREHMKSTRGYLIKREATFVPSLLKPFASIAMYRHRAPPELPSREHSNSNSLLSLSLSVKCYWLNASWYVKARGQFNKTRRVNWVANDSHSLSPSRSP